MNTLITDHDRNFQPVHDLLEAHDAFLTRHGGARFYYLRTAMRALAVAPAAQRRLERYLTTHGESFAWYLVFDRTRHCLLVDERAMIEVCIASPTAEAREFTRWWVKAVAVLHEHGYYNPATNHEAPPGQELDALELREQLNDGLRQALPGLFDLPKYYLVDGEVIPADEYHQQHGEDDDE